MILSKLDIEDYAETILRQFDHDGKSPLDIRRFATKFLGLNIVCRQLSVEGDILGVTTYADVEITMPDRGYVRPVLVRKNTILVCNSINPELKNPSKNLGRFRFTIAHECAHQILYRLEPDERQHSLRQLENRPYSMRELKSRDDWSEWQANALAAALLMPARLIREKMCEDRITLYGKRLNTLDKIRVDRLQNNFSVSRTALLLRLSELGLLERRTEREYYDPLEIWNDEDETDTSADSANAGGTGSDTAGPA